MGNQTSATIRKMTIRRPSPDEDDEYSQEDIRRKYDNMPRLNDSEKKVLRSSWKLIHKKVDQVRPLAPENLASGRFERVNEAHMGTLFGNEKA